MFNKILLACCSKKEVALGERLARVRIILSDIDEVAVGGHAAIAGSLEVIEGSIDVVYIVDIPSAPQTACVMPLSVASIGEIVLVNETTGITKKQYYVADNLDGNGIYQCYYGLFAGLELGQECVIAIHLKG